MNYDWTISVENASAFRRVPTRTICLALLALAKCPAEPIIELSLHFVLTPGSRINFI